MKKLLTVFAFGAFTLGFSQSGYYNDYRSSITGINWQTLAAELLLTPTQKQQLFALNNQYPSYDAWNNVYRNNPDQWRYDRYSSIERILGKDKYTKFKNKYYKGQNPVAVYNRNKNNYKKYQTNKYQSLQNRKSVAPKAKHHAIRYKTTPEKGKYIDAKRNGAAKSKGKVKN